MLGLYADMRVGRQGLTLSAPLNDDLDMTNRWNRLKKGGSEDRFPAPTFATSQVEIAMLYAFREFMKFSWFDYPGDALNVHEADAFGVDLGAKMNEANTVLVCLPGNDLIQYARTGDSELPSLNIAELNRHFASIRDRNERDEDRPAIVVVVTKYDAFLDALETNPAGLREGLETLGIDPAQCADPDRQAQYVLEECVKSVLHPLFVDQSGFHVLISPATLGAQLARAPATGALEPKWLAHPLMFSYIVYAETLMSQCARAIDAGRGQVDELEGRFLRFLVRDEIADARAAIARAARRAAEIGQRLDIARRLLPSWAIVWRDGVRISGHDYGR